MKQYETNRKNAINLNAMVVLIGYNDTMPYINGDPGRTVELARTVTGTSESSDERAILIIDLYTIIGSVADEEIFAIANDSPWTTEVVRIETIAIIADDHDLRAPDQQFSSVSIWEDNIAVVIRYWTTAWNPCGNRLIEKTQGW